MLELQDAETVPAGRVVWYGGLANGADLAGLYHDSSRHLAGSFMPAVQGGATLGLGEHVDAGASVWTSAPLAAPATGFQAFDAGIRAGTKIMLTERRSRNRVALSLGGWLYGATNVFASDNSADRGYGWTAGGSSAAIYSFVLNPADSAEQERVRSLYAGLRCILFRGDFTYGIVSDSLPDRTVGSFAGTRLGYGALVGFSRGTAAAAEVACFVTPGLDPHTTAWTLLLGLRFAL
ncbi:MAG: hypothetical protein JST22_10605 [Bacteroidetes bacterium]|nr:hypothetical protein [Bacteroidota bacterium]